MFINRMEEFSITETVKTMLAPMNHENKLNMNSLGY